MRHMLAVTTILILAACSLPQKTQPTLKADIPQTWVSEEKKPSLYVQSNWVVTFGDEILISLVEEALAHNQDLQITAAAMERARAEAKRAGADLAPMIDLSTSAARSDTGSAGNSGFGVPSPSNEYDVSLEVSWEADVWGRLRAGKAASEYEYYAAEYDLKAARHSLAAQTTKAYFLVIETTRQLELAKGYEANLQKTLDVTRAFFEEGLTSKRDTHVIQADLARARERVQNAESAQRHAARGLEVLLGRYPAAEVTASNDFPELPERMPAGIPSHVLERRPDIRAAERRVAAAFFRVEEAKAAKLPSITLTGSFGRNSQELNNLTDPGSAVWNIAGNLLFPIFNAGKLNAAIDIETAAQKEAIAGFQQIALDTFSEVEAALSDEHLFRTRQEYLDDAYANAKTSELIADENFKIGELDLLDLLQIKGTTITTNIDRIRSHRELLDQRVNLHLALGGGVSRDTDAF